MLSTNTRSLALAVLQVTSLAAVAAGCAGGGAIDAEDVGDDAEALCPAPKTVRGVDVAHYQGTIDWKRARNAGIGFAFASVGDGAGYVDPTFGDNWRHTKDAGVVRGAYQFFRPTQDPKAQADLLVHQIEHAGGLHDGDLPPALDIETSDGASDSTVVNHAKTWLEHVEHALHRTPVVYVSPGFWSGLGNPSSFGKYPLWVANWGVSCPSLPGGSWSQFAFWQYSDHGSVPGIPGTVDLDRFNGSMDDLRKLARGGGGPSLGAEEATVMAEELDDDGSTDVDGDGKADLCARTANGIRCHLSTGDGFASDAIDGPGLDDGDTWNGVDHYATIRFADIDGDGRADVCARGRDGLDCWRSNGHGFGAKIATGLLAGDAWDEARHYGTIRLADVDGDGRADLCARNADGVSCWLANGHGFDHRFDGPALSDDGRFAHASGYGTIRMADIDGDGKADLCALRGGGIVCFRSDGDGFPHKVEGPRLDGDAWDAAARWATIRFADLDGDGRADLCVRRSGGVTCWLSEGDGFGHGIDGPALSDDAGWSRHDRYSTIRLADVDGDGKADLCARAGGGMKCWPSTGHGFGAPFAIDALADDAHGDRPNQYRTIRFADVDGDGRMDLCFRASGGVRCRLGAAHGFGASFRGPTWSDDDGWSSEKRYATIALQ
jgi:GH25 family lysozyme M1 (1,4-beta-N-acetylmuramidase)